MIIMLFEKVDMSKGVLGNKVELRRKWWGWYEYAAISLLMSLSTFEEMELRKREKV